MLAPDSNPIEARLDRRVVLVLGMHRSGTSALTRTLALSGATLPKNLMRPHKANETGFWEPEKIVQLNSDFLASIGAVWDETAALPDALFAPANSSRYRKLLLKALRAEFDADEIAIVKDPRICRLLPLWLPLLDDFGAKPYAVIIMRNPLEVAGSLHAHHGLPLEKTLILWLRHFIEAERYTRSLPRSFVSYAELIKDGNLAVDKIGRDLGIEWTRRSEVASAEIREFLNVQLRHHNHSQDDFCQRADIPDWIKAVYHWAEQAQQGLKPDPSILDDLGRQIDIADQMFSPVLSSMQKSLRETAAHLEVVNDDLIAKNQLSVAKDAEIAARDHKIASTLDELARALDELARARGSNIHLHEALHQSEAHSADRGVNLARAQGTIATLESKVGMLTHAIAEARNEISEARNEISEARNEKNVLLQSVTESRDRAIDLEHQITALRSSSSWKITGPLRRLVRLVRKTD